MKSQVDTTRLQHFLCKIIRMCCSLVVSIWDFMLQSVMSTQEFCWSLLCPHEKCCSLMCPLEKCCTLMCPSEKCWSLICPPEKCCTLMCPPEKVLQSNVSTRKNCCSLNWSPSIKQRWCNLYSDPTYITYKLDNVSIRIERTKRFW